MNNFKKKYSFDNEKFCTKTYAKKHQHGKSCWEVGGVAWRICIPQYPIVLGELQLRRTQCNCNWFWLDQQDKHNPNLLVGAHYFFLRDDEVAYALIRKITNKTGEKYFDNSFWVAFLQHDELPIKHTLG